MLENDNLHLLVFEWVFVPSGLEGFEQCVTTNGKVSLQKKAYSDLNYLGYKTIHIILPFTRSRESKDMEILGTEFQLTMIL